MLQSVSPAVSTSSAMDIYLLVSMIFVFCTIMEFAAVLHFDQAMKYAERLRKHDSDVSNCNKLSNGKIFAIESHMEEVRRLSKQPPSSKLRKFKLFDISINKANGKKVVFWKHGFTNKIDFISFFAFMFCYCLFNVIYAIKYTK